jgi:tetratricopeptide (TPR) repeat protein
MSFKLLPYGPGGAFSIGVYEVTQQQYEAVIGSNPSEFKGANNPVEQVSWDDAVAYCAKLSSLPAEVAAGRVYRLPTESEWEYACRAGTTTEYSFGDDEQDLGKYAWFDGNSGETTHAVGKKLPNVWGLYDMHGNVWEWCLDAKGSNRVVRGGSWFNSASYCRPAYSGCFDPSYRSNSVGFRLALSPSGKADAQKAGKEAAEEIKRIDSSLPTDPEKTKGPGRVLAGLLLAERAELVVEIAPDQALENARLAVKLNPSLQESCWDLLANLMEARGNGSLKASMDFYHQSVEASEWKEKRTLLEESIAADPTFPWSYNNLAWDLATYENLAERNAQDAVKFALKACELDGYHYWSFLDTLAASYAENGQFPEAVLRMTQAIANCPDESQRKEMLELLKRYKSGKRFPFPDGQEGVD